MQPIGMFGIFEVLGQAGILGLIIVLWWVDMKKIYKILDRYKRDMDEQRMMYERNVSLVKDYYSLGSDLKDVVILNTEAMTKLIDHVQRPGTRKGR